MDIEIRLRNLADKWRYANSEVYEVCRDAVEEIRVLKTKEQKNSLAYDPGASGWGKGKDE